MTADALLVVQCLFNVIWRLFTSWHIPGTATTPAAFFLFLGFAVVSIRFFKRFLTGMEGRGDSK